MTLEKTDVAIIGSGIVGSSAAYFLSESGAKVTIIDPNPHTDNASVSAAGIINPIDHKYMTKDSWPFTQAAYEIHKYLWPILQSNPAFPTKTLLKLSFNHAETEINRIYLESSRKTPGISTKWLSTEQAIALEPRMPHNIHGALMINGVGVVNSSQYTQSWTNAANKYGAKTKKSNATGLQECRKQITGVRLGSQVLPCKSVILTMGPWTSTASSWIQTDIPISPLKGEIIHVTAPNPPLTYVVEHNEYMAIPKHDGNVWMASTVESSGFNKSITDTARVHLSRIYRKMFPNITQCNVVSQTACLRPIAPDNFPIIGRVPDWKGLYIATGAGKKGILLGPAMGRAISDMITQGYTSLPIDRFSFTRFT